jgi:hypothetical protein
MRSSARSLTRRLVVLAVLAAAAAPALAAPERDALLRPGRGIGKVELGMTVDQVRRALGRPQFVNRRVELGFGTVYVEYAWDYAVWTVGFQGRPGRLRAVKISTALRAERTRQGLGVGSRIREVVRVFPSATCLDTNVGRLVIVRSDRRRTVFVFASEGFADPRPLHASEVVVHDGIPIGRFGARRVSVCRAGWERA